MPLLESAQFLIDIGQSYARPAALVAVANLGAVVAVRAFLPTLHFSLLSRGGVFVIAGCLGGLTAVVEAFAVVALSGLMQEAAGMALLFLPFVLTPPAVASLSWLFATTRSSTRPTLALAGSLLGAVLISPLVPILFGYARRLSVLSDLYTIWMLLGVPLAAGATLGCMAVRRARW